MKEKLVKIDRCSECPNMDCSYYEYIGECVLLDKVIQNTIPDGWNTSFSIHMGIHPECPLEDA